MTTRPILSRSISSLLVLGTAATLTVSESRAASGTWNGTTDALWSTPLNWSGGSVPGTGDTATFNNAGNAKAILDLGAGVTINTILFDTATAAAYTIGSGAVGSQTLTLDNAGAITVNSTVVNSQLFNSNIVLGTDGTAQTFTFTNQGTVAGKTLTIAGGITGSTGAGLKTLAVAGAGATVISGVIGNGTTGTVAVSKSDAGTLTLSGVNTYTGGTTLNGGKLNVNSTGALGTATPGALTITGGTLDNSSGAAITTLAAIPQNWNGDFTFAGTSDLNFNLGPMTIGGAAGTRTVNVTAGTLSTGTWTGAAGFGLTKTGAGTLAMTSTANTSNIAGALDIQAGKVQMSGDLTIGGLTGAGTIENGGAAAKWLFVNTATDNTFSGTIQDGASARLGLVKRGVGTLNLTGANNSYRDNFAIENGTVRLTGTNTVGGTSLGTVSVGNVANQNGVLIVDGGTLNANKTNNPSLAVGNAANARGFIKMTSGAITTTNELHIGNGNGASGTNPYAALTMSGGTLTSGNWLVVGFNNDRAVLNETGGSITVTTNRMTIGAGGAGSIGVVNLSGGTFSNPTGIFVGENGTGTLNVSGTAAATMGNLQFAGNATSIAGTVNLLGGSLSTGSITQVNGAGTYLFNFNGGTLKPTGSNAGFFASPANTTAYVHAGGAKIDTNGFDIAISQPLVAPAGSGLSSIAVATGGAGYIDTPLVTITGGTGIGAQAVANVSGGVVTGFTITNPGSGYSSGDVLTATIFGGGATTAATAGTITLAANASGGLTKTGAGVLTISGANTYTGATTINGGTLLIDGTGTINTSSGITINGAGAKLTQNNAASLTPLVTVTNGALDGTGTFDRVTVSDGGTLINGAATGTALTIGTLTFNGVGALNLQTTAGAPVSLITTNLITGATNAAGLLSLNLSNTNTLWTSGTYSLISYTTLGGQGFSKITKGTIAGLGARQSATLTNAAGVIGLTIGGDLPVWTGAQNGNWTTNVIGGASNWKLQTAGTATDFITGDTVLFDDTATGSTAVSISTANVSPISTTFNNSTKNYTISSAGGFGIATGFLQKSGTGSLTLNTANTYSGGTTLTDGVLNINNASAIGTGTLTINGGTIDNTSAGAITLTTNNPQTWSADFTYGGTNDLNLGTGAVPLTASRTITTAGTHTLTVGGVISGGSDLTKAGTGTLALSGNNTFTGATTVHEGTLTLTGAINSANAANVGLVTVGDTADINAVLNIAGGTLNATKTSNPSIAVGSTFGSNGFVKMGSGAITTSSEFHLGRGSGGYAAFTMTGGTVTTGSWLVVGFDNDRSVLNQSGGTITVGTQRMTIAARAGAIGTYNMSGTASHVATSGTAGMYVGEGGVGTLNISGNATLSLATNGLRIGQNAGSDGTVNLLGGTITTNLVANGLGTGTFNFNGGTLKATGANATFMTGVTNAYVYPGGATIDDGGFAITVGQALLAPTGNGVSATGLTVSGSGYIDTPLVEIIGDGVGAKAVATINASGTLTGITITNPGVGYTTAPTFNLIGGGFGNTGAIGGTATLVANTSGSLTKQGTGTLTLPAVNTYTGGTTVNAGSLILSGDNNFGTGGLTLNGGSATLSGNNTYSGATILNGGTLILANTTGSATGTGPVTVKTGATLTGAGSAAGLVTVASGGILSPGASGVGTITVGSLTLSAGSFLNYDITDAGTLDRTTVTTSGGLSINGGAFRLLQTGTSTAFSSNGTYNLIGYTGALGGTGASALGIDSPVPNKTYTFGSFGGFVTLTIATAGSTANFWNVNANGNWTTAGNWSLNSAPNGASAIANFGGGGVTITAPRTVTLDANQTVGTVSFNSTQPYTISGANTLTLNNGADPVTSITDAGGNHTIGVALAGTSATTQFTVVNAADTLTVSGVLSGTTNVSKGSPGKVLFTGANTYTGTTTVTGGTLAVSGAGKLGNTANALAVSNGGTVDLGGTSQTTTALTVAGGTISNGTLTPTSTTVNGAIASTISANLGGSGGVTKNDAGTLTLSGNNTYAGNTVVNGGVLALASANALGSATNTLQFTTGALQVDGTALTNLGATRTLTGFPTAVTVTDANNTFTIPQSAVGTALVKQGAGTLVLPGDYALPGANTVHEGALTLTGAINSANTANIGLVTVGDTANINAVLNIAGGTLNATRTTSPSIAVGSVAGSDGFVRMSSGTVTTSSEFHLGRGAGSYAAFTMTGGVVTTGNWLVVGFNNDKAVLNQSGGTITDNGNRMTIAAGGSASVGVYNASGGTFTSTSASGGMYVGENGTGTLNVSAAGSVILATNGLRIGQVAGSNGTVNLLGGTITTNLVTNGAGTSTFNFNGGTLKANAANATFMTGVTSAYVYAGGAVIDDGGFAIGIDQALLAPTDSGVSATGLTASGSGFIDTPLVQVTGDGIGATAVAKIDASGNLTGITVTNPGVGYFTAPTFALLGGGAGNTGMITGTATLVPNVGGGLTKRGAGTLTLSGFSTYTGPTVVEAGTLAVTGSISGSTSIAVKQAATLDASANGLVLASGQTLRGSGTVLGAVTLSQASKLAPGDNAGTLTFTGLVDLTAAITQSASAALLFELGAPGASDQVVLTGGALTIGAGVLALDDFAFTPVAGLTSGTYKLFDGNAPIVGSLDSNAAHLTGAIGAGFTGTLALADGGNDLVLTVVPEPGSATMLLGGLGGLLGFRRFRRRAM